MRRPGPPYPHRYNPGQGCHSARGGPAEPYLAGFAYWTKPGGKGSELCLVLGSYLEDNNLGTVDALTPELRAS